MRPTKICDPSGFEFGPSNLAIGDVIFYRPGDVAGAFIWLARSRVSAARSRSSRSTSRTRQRQEATWPD
jgi:hypothetical protein